jgi:hypothetical protein
MKLTLIPMTGRVQDDRLYSLRGCHALLERKAVKQFDNKKEFEAALLAAMRELLLADRLEALDGRISYVLTLELLP